MSTAYIIFNSSVAAVVGTEIANGANVTFSTVKAKEEINANRDFNLVNAHSGKISRAKRWEKEAAKCDYFGSEINPTEFFIK
ncbi:hypothetical protein LF927_09140 [Pectobacterium polaris]|uniref:hypothetical protein n=1 Tax=Pectobacterium polaris TaxID=2042057 RepID=UPI001CF3E924|nr:hypothetical protein [Pectobacterium polaris]MCA6941348.1 hypothetical protein [Pectobacterium polaris]MCA6956402.1 hypothetical protein [Pectobacterium polaris]